MTVMGRLWPRTLLWQVGLAIMLLQAIVGLAFGGWAVAKLKQFHYQQTSRELLRLAPVVAEAFEALLPAAAPDRVDQLARRLGRSTGVRVTVIRPDGIVIGDSEHDAAVMDNHRFRPEVDQAVRLGSGSTVRFSQTLGTDMMYVAWAAGGTGDASGIVRVAVPLSAVDARLAGLIRVLGLAWVLSTACTLAVIYLIWRNLSLTVSRLAGGARRFAAGDFQHRIIPPSSRELATVTDAFNQMAERLAAQIGRLDAQQNEQQAILQSMSNGVLALDAGQHVLSINRAGQRLLGVDGNAARGRLLAEVLRDPQLNRFVGEAMAGSKRAADDLVFAGQPPRSLQATGEPLVDAEGRVVGLLVILNDVTQLRRLESIRSDFAANVSHELQTPITAIKGYIETLLEDPELDSDQSRQFLQIAGRNADRLAAIIEDLLELARLEDPGAGQRLQRGDTPVAELVGSVVGRLGPAAREKGLTFEVNVPADLTAPVNAQLIEHAVANLVSNAVKYSPPDTTITIGAAGIDGRFELTVADQGPGIAPEHLGRLFERFYRVDRARSRALGGTGLGLAIVKHVALVHGGRAEIESEVGRGSVFRIILPVPAATGGPPDRG